MVTDIQGTNSPAVTMARNTPPHKNRFSVSRTAGTMPVWHPRATTASYAADDALTPATSIKTGPSFKDVLDVINPLQHIPVVGTIYRKITGDEISSSARIIGGTLFGGPIGGALAMADVAVQEQTGSSIGDKAYNLVSRDSGKTQMADATPAMITLPSHFTLNGPRMAGSMPVWNSDGAANTRFAAMLNTISNEKYQIS